MIRMINHPPTREAKCGRKGWYEGDYYGSSKGSKGKGKSDKGKGNKGGSKDWY